MPFFMHEYRTYLNIITLAGDKCSVPVTCQTDTFVDIGTKCKWRVCMLCENVFLIQDLLF